MRKLKPERSLILASGSVIRARLLEQAGLVFKIHPANLNEANIKKSLRAENINTKEAATILAEMKALQVSRNFPEDLILGADQILEYKESWFSKPSDLKMAKDHLIALRGQKHVLCTSAVLVQNGIRLWNHSDQAILSMRGFSDAFLDEYVAEAGEDILHSVGAYQLEGLGIQLFDKIEGDYFTILGLPLLSILEALRVQGMLER